MVSLGDGCKGTILYYCYVHLIFFIIEGFKNKNKIQI